MLKFWHNKEPQEEATFRIFRIILWLAPCVLLLFLVERHYIPFGKYSVTYKVNNTSTVFRNFASKEPYKLLGTKNIEGDKDIFQMITVSPLYFDVKVPRPFAKATVNIQYQNPDSQEVIQLAVRQANKAYAYYPMAYANSTLDSLADYWEVIRDGDVYLWQKNAEYFNKTQLAKQAYTSRKKKLDEWKALQDQKITTIKQSTNIEEEYQRELKEIFQDSQIQKSGSVPFSSIQDFFKTIPPRTSVTQYNYDLTKYYELSGYKPNTNAIEFNNVLRGKHEIVTYLADNESLDFSFVTQDINRHVGEDTISISVYGPSGTLIKNVKEPDDGNTNANGVVLPERIVKINANNLAHGVYRLVLDTNGDIFFKKIISFQHMIMFKNNIYLANSPEYKSIIGDIQFSPSVVYTNSTTIKAYTSHRSNFQTLRVGTQNLILDRLNENSAMSLSQPVTSITTTKNDVSIEGDGYFSFSEDGIFNPDITTAIPLHSVINIDKYDYIIAKYQQPKNVGDWLQASATIEAPQLYFDKGNDLIAHFMINLPNMHESGKTLLVKEVTINFEKPPITPSSLINKLLNQIGK